MPNFNGAAFFLDCLRSLDGQTTPPDEIVVVDNGSTDDSVALLRREFPSARLVELPTNLGFAGGANAGVRVTSSPLVAVLNSDARPAPDWLERLLSVVVQSDEDIWAWGSVLVDSSTGLVESGGDEWSPRGFAYKRDKGTDPDGLPVEPYETFAPPGAAPLFRREVFDALGGYHDRFFLYYEDIDLAYRARRAGYRAVVVPSARVAHDLGRSSAGGSGRARFYIARNSLWCTVRNEERLAPRLWWSRSVEEWRYAKSGGYRRPYLAGRLAALAGLPSVLLERRRLRRDLSPSGEVSPKRY